MMVRYPQTHEDASEGASEKNRYRNTSDLSNEVQRANASGNVPPTKFKAARSRFFVGRDGVSHPRNAEMRFSFRRSLQIEFLARETPNCTLPRTYTHPINGHARA